MFDRILVPIDFTRKSSFAVKAAVQLAANTMSKVDLMHIVEIPLISKTPQHGGHEEAEQVPSKLAANLIKAAKEKLTRIKNEHKDKGVEINIRVKIDELPERVAELITQEDYDLIVIAGNTAYQFYEFVKKTHPERVVELAKCPVLVLNEEMASFDLEKLVLPTSLEGDICAVSENILAFADFFNASLELLFVNTPVDFKSSDEIQKLESEFKSKNKMEKHQLVVISERSVKKGIIKYAQSSGSNLLILTSRHSNKILSVFRGDITEYLVNHSKFPILTFNLRTKS